MIRASEYGHTPVVDVLLKHKAQVDLQNKVSTECGDTLEPSKLLMLHSVPCVDCVPLTNCLQHGHTALMEASKQGHTAVVGMLLEHNARVDLLNLVSTGCEDMC